MTEQRRRHEPDRPRRVRRPLVLAAAAAALALAVAVLVVVAVDPGRDGDGEAPDRGEAAPAIGRAGSEVVDERPDEPLPIDDIPTSYRVTYRVEAPIEGVVDVTTEVLAVRRPFDSVVRSHPGEDAEGSPTSGRIATFGRFSIISGDAQPLVLAARPGVSPSDVRLEPALQQALEDDQLEWRERRTVAGRECQVYRSLDPLGSGSIAPALGDRYTDTCVGADGLVLEELLVAGDDPLLRRIATTVDTEVELGSEDFEITAPAIDVKSGGGSLLRMAEGSRPPDTFWEPGGAPEGFEPCGRFSFVAPQEQPEDPDDPLQQANPVASTVDVWVRGPDVLVLEQGAPLRGSAPFELGARQVDLGAVGPGDVVLGTQGNAVRALLGGGRFLRLIGTLPVSELLEVVRSLEEAEAGTLEVVEGTPACDG